MTTIDVRFIEIDSEVGRVLGHAWTLHECGLSREIRAVRNNHFLYVWGQAPAAWLPATREIILDLSAPPECIRQRLKNRFPDSLLLADHQIWRAAFLHEVGHSLNREWGEQECDYYAIDRLGCAEGRR